MKFYFDGCSFTAGGGFKKYGYEEYKDLIWPHHIGEHFNAEVHNFAIGGACETCAMSVMTLKQGIEKKLMMEIPDVKGVVQVL